MRESKPLPQIAVTALTLAQAEFQRVANEIARQTLDVMQRSGEIEGDGWTVDVQTGAAFREVPDIAPAREGAA